MACRIVGFILGSGYFILCFILQAPLLKRLLQRIRENCIIKQAHIVMLNLKCLYFVLSCDICKELSHRYRPACLLSVMFQFHYVGFS